MQNITGNPALTLPHGILTTGLPFGLQVSAPHFEDQWLLDIAERFETAYPWARFAPGYEDFEL